MIQKSIETQLEEGVETNTFYAYYEGDKRVSDIMPSKAGATGRLNRYFEQRLIKYEGVSWGKDSKQIKEMVLKAISEGIIQLKEL